MTFGLLSFFIGGIVTILSNNPYIALLAKVFQGGATSIVLIVGCAFLHDSLSNIKAIKTLALVKSFTILPVILAPLASNLWVEQLGLPWRHLIGLNVLVGTLFFLGMTIYLVKLSKRGFFTIEKSVSVSSISSSIFKKTFLSNVFTQNLSEVPFYLWLTFAPVHCDTFILHHTIVLGFGILGMIASSRLASVFDVNKLLTAVLAFSLISVLSFTAVFFMLGLNTWKYLFIPAALVTFAYGVEVPILDRSIAISLSNKDKTVTLGFTFFINYAVYFAFAEGSFFIINGSGTIILMLMCAIFSIVNILNIYRVRTIK